MRKLLVTMLALLLFIEASASVILKKGQSFASQVRMANTRYEIRDVFDLRGATIKVPSGCTLVFLGGSVKNGTLDLNGCRIEGVGIKCHIKNPTDYAYPLSRYLADSSNEELNVSVVQSLMDAAVPVIIDYPKLVFSKNLSVTSNVVVQSASEKRVLLNFPNSRGFVFEDPLKYMPGHHVYNFEDLKQFIVDISNNKDVYKEDRHNIMNEVHNPCDNYCKRIVDTINELYEKKNNK